MKINTSFIKIIIFVFLLSSTWIFIGYLVSGSVNPIICFLIPLFLGYVVAGSLEMTGLSITRTYLFNKLPLKIDLIEIESLSIERAFWGNGLRVVRQSKNISNTVSLFLFSSGDQEKIINFLKNNADLSMKLKN